MDQLLEQVQDLVSQGFGRCVIARELNINAGKATKLINKVREMRVDVPIPPQGGQNKGKVTRLQEIGELWETGEYDTYAIAKRYKTSPITATNTIRKIEGTYDPTGDWLQRCSKYGVKYSFLKIKFSLRSVDRAIEMLKESFPGCFISKIKEGEDWLLTPIPDSTGEFDLLQVDLKKKKELFTYYLAPAGNYMKVKINDDLPGDEIKIYNISDTHLGSKACRDTLFKEHLDMIDQDPMALAQCGGDFFENNSKQSVGSQSDEYLTATEQVSYTAKTMSPYAHKYINYIAGNHEQRTERFSSLDIGKPLGDLLKLPYFTHGIFIEYEWRGQRWIQFHTHRYGNAYDDSAIKKEVKKIMSQHSFHTNWFSSGHTHSAWISRLENTILIPGRGFEGADVYVVNAGSHTEDTGTYSAKYGRSPKDLTYITMHESGAYGASSVIIRSL